MLTDVPENEQWLLEGNCDKCRRKSYCTKQCKKRKRNLGSGIFMFDGTSNIPKKITPEELEEIQRRYATDNK